MQEVLVLEGLQAGTLIGLLESLGIEALAELQAEGAGAGAGVRHPWLGNRSSGGEGAVQDAEYYVLYVVTDAVGF